MVGTSGDGVPLRDLLGLSGRDPEFEIKLLPGWERRSPDTSDQVRLEAALKRRMMEVHRPDLYGPVRAMLDESYRAMRQQGAVAFYAATGGSDAVQIPGTMIATIRKAPAGGSLDDLVRSAVREYGAKPLFGDLRIMRFEREKIVTLEESSVVQTSIVYMTPVPGSKRRRALQFNASFGRPVEVPADDNKVRAWRMAFDACVSTLRWKPSRAGM